MKYALVGDERQEAAHGLTATCPVCDAPVIAKCGEIKVWHWAHKSCRRCDAWWERETDWHRAWKNHFPQEWQEVVQRAPDGDKHIADVKTDKGVVLEFQHSYLKPEERRARETFYGKMVWVVDGLRLKRDRAQFFRALRDGVPVRAAPLSIAVYSDESRFLKNWAGAGAPVFFDFGETSEPEDALRFNMPVLWLKHPVVHHGRVLVTPVVKAAFLDTYLKNAPLNALAYTPPSKPRRARLPPRPGRKPSHRPRQPMSFKQYVAKMRAKQRLRRL